MKTSLVASAVLAIVTGCSTPHYVAVNPCPPAPAVPASLNSVGGKFSLLPTAVQRTITIYSGSAEISDITKTSGSQDVYQVEFKEPESNPTLYVSLDGTPAYSETPFFPFLAARFSTILPAAVQATLEAQAPNAAISNIEPNEVTLYQISFADANSHPSLQILEDGTVLEPKPERQTSAR